MRRLAVILCCACTAGGADPERAALLFQYGPDLLVSGSDGIVLGHG